MAHRTPPIDGPHVLTRITRIASRRILTAGLMVAALAAGSTGAAESQEFGRLFRSTELTLGARSMAMGMTAPIGLGDVDAVFIHPGLAYGARGTSATYSTFQDGARGWSLATGLDWAGLNVGLSVRSLDYEILPVAGSAGVFPEGLEGLGGFPGTAGDPTSETAATLTVATSIFGFGVGLSGRSVIQRTNGLERRTVQSVDVGLAREIGPVTAALSGRNLSSADGMPAEAVVGMGSQRAPLGPLDVGVTAQFRVPEDGDVTAGGGVEVAWWPIQGRTFIARLGFRDQPGDVASPWSLGAGFEGDRVHLGWAWVPVDGGSGFHRITLGWR